MPTGVRDAADDALRPDRLAVRTDRDAAFGDRPGAHSRRASRAQRRPAQKSSLRCARLGRDYPGETERRSCAVVRALQSCPCRTETPGQRHAAGKGLARAGEGPRADSRCTPEILRTASPAPVVDFSPHLPRATPARPRAPVGLPRCTAVVSPLTTTADRGTATSTPLFASRSAAKDWFPDPVR